VTNVIPEKIGPNAITVKNSDGTPVHGDSLSPILETSTLLTSTPESEISENGNTNPKKNIDRQDPSNHHRVWSL